MEVSYHLIYYLGMKYSSAYQGMKPVIQEFLGLTRDAIHIHIGFICFLASYLIFKKKRNSAWPLLPGLILSFLMEIKDNFDSYSINQTLNFPASLHDIVNTNLIPVLVYGLLKFQIKG